MTGAQDTEGVIKFNLDFEQMVLQTNSHEGGEGNGCSVPVRAGLVDEVSAWRDIMKALGLLGQVPDRYEGYGFGNLSVRLSQGFLITGTQTGHLTHIGIESLAHCLDWHLAENSVRAQGLVKPSSESLSHAAVYAAQPRARCAFHVHSPDLWRAATQLAIVVTRKEVPYGTPEMASEVARCIKPMQLPGIFAMGGHQDGVFVFGETPAQAGLFLIECLVSAKMVATGMAPTRMPHHTAVLTDG